MANSISLKLWRGLKVIYFLITIPLTILVVSIAFEAPEIYHWTDPSGRSIYVADHSLWLLYSLLIIVGYVILTDLIRRLISYISDGSFKGFIDYMWILIGNFYYILIGLGLVWILGYKSYDANHQCENNYERYDEYWTCSCWKGYIRNNQGMCEVDKREEVWKGFVAEYSWWCDPTSTNKNYIQGCNLFRKTLYDSFKMGIQNNSGEYIGLTCDDDNYNWQLDCVGQRAYKQGCEFEVNKNLTNKCNQEKRVTMERINGEIDLCEDISIEETSFTWGDYGGGKVCLENDTWGEEEIKLQKLFDKYYTPGVTENK